MRPSNTRAMGQMSPVARYWQTTNAPDYLGLFVTLVSWVLVLAFVNPFHRLFFIDDHNIRYPHAEVERVPVAWNFVYALFIPLGVLILANTFVLRSTPDKHEATYLPFLISICVTSLLTDIIKNAVGRPRPDLMDRCQPSDDAPRDRPVDISVCTAPDGHKLQDGWRSFPSGHSSFSFAGLGFTALFLAGQLGVFGMKRDLGRALFCMVPLIGAAMIAISRCEDYRHDVYDVCVGSALGMTVAFWSYRRYWPRLSSPVSHIPYPYPGSVIPPEVGAHAWQRVRDEEEGGAGDAAGGRVDGASHDDVATSPGGNDVGYELDTLRQSNRG